MPGFQDIKYALPDKLSCVLHKVSKSYIDNISEIRLRTNKPVAIKINGKTMFLDCYGGFKEIVTHDLLMLSVKDMNEAFSKLCEHSLYSKQHTLCNGYVVMRSGCRAGVCGDFSDVNCSLRQVSSINIRIAHQVPNADNDLYSLMGQRPESVLIVGAPCSGKTTVLRELCRRYSDKLYNVCILDEKSEIAAVNNGICSFDVGVCTDVISLKSKSESSSIALKLMNPDIIAFDELADDSGVLNNCSRCGVKVFATMHSDSVEDALYRMESLKINKSIFNLIVVLNRTTFSIKQIYWIDAK